MTKRKIQNNQCKQPSIVSGIYGLGFIGTFVYYLQQSTNFWQGFFGFFKSIVWPAILAFKLFQFLHIA